MFFFLNSFESFFFLVDPRGALNSVKAQCGLLFFFLPFVHDQTGPVIAL